MPAGSVYRFLARERGRLVPAELFADLFEATGRRSVPPSILAVVLVLQRLEGLSDREAADRFAFDVRWRYAAGVADAVAGEETASFVSTVLVDFRARLRRSAHYALRDQRLDPSVTEAARLLASVTGQDIEEIDDGCSRIFEGTAPGRVISTVNPEARHGHKTTAHGFDGYKDHVAVDPDSKIICAAEVSPAATGDATVAPTLLGDLLPDQGEQLSARAMVYGTGANLAWLNAHGLTPMVKTVLPTAPGGRFGKDQFRVDLQAQTVTCPARATVAITPARRGGGRARFGAACSVCPLRDGCTISAHGRLLCSTASGWQLQRA